MSPQPRGRSGQRGKAAWECWPGHPPCSRANDRGRAVPGAGDGPDSPSSHPSYPREQARRASVVGMHTTSGLPQAGAQSRRPAPCPRPPGHCLFRPFPGPSALPHLELCPSQAKSPTGCIQPCRKTASCYVLMGESGSALFLLTRGQLRVPAA